MLSRKWEVSVGISVKKQVSKMGRKSKVTKKVVCFANGSAARGAGVDGSAGEFVVEGMGLQGLPEVAGGGSGEESNAVGAQDQPVGPAPAARWGAAGGGPRFAGGR